jgi:hypothetical protein
MSRVVPGGDAAVSVARFVGVGVGRYDHGHPELERAVPDVEEFARRLGGAFTCEVLPDPGEEAARRFLKAVRGTLPEGG